MICFMGNNQVYGIKLMSSLKESDKSFPRFIVV